MDYIKIITQEKLTDQEALDNLFANAINTAKEAFEAKRTIVNCAAPGVPGGLSHRVIECARAYSEICDLAAKRARALVDKAMESK